MPAVIIYSLALLGALTLVASVGLLVIVLLDHRGRRRATHRKAHEPDRGREPAPAPVA